LSPRPPAGALLAAAREARAASLSRRGWGVVAGLGAGLLSPSPPALVPAEGEAEAEAFPSAARDVSAANLSRPI
jgi:hypothetical protein